MEELKALNESILASLEQNQDGNNDETEEQEETSQPPRSITILDGGMGHLLRRMGVKIEGKVGSLERFLNVATCNVTNPMLVERAHLEFLKAGAQVITTNSYACIPNVLTKTEVIDTDESSPPIIKVGSEDYAVNNKEIAHQDLEKYIIAAGKCGANAKKLWNEEKNKGDGENFHDDKCIVAASIPPLNASYRYDLVESKEVLQRDYAFITKTIEPYVDIFLCETMSTIEEAIAAGTAASKFNKPVWISFTLSEYEEHLGNLRSSESVVDAVKMCVKHVGPNLKAILCNCSSITSISKAIVNIVNTIVELGLEESIEIGAYANGFEATDEFVQEVEDAECDIEKLVENINADVNIRDEYRKDMSKFRVPLFINYCLPPLTYVYIQMYCTI